MYARLSSVMFPIAALLFVGAILWGYQEHQEKNAILIKAENQYQRAFHELNSHMSRLVDELGQTLAVSSKSHGLQRKGLANVWRLTSEAQNEINQLPLALLPFNEAEQFLSKMSNFAYRASVRDLSKEPLSPEEIKTLKALYEKAKEVSAELGKIQEAVIKDRLRWMDVEIAIASERNQSDNTIIDGFRKINKKMGEYPETDWGPAGMTAKSINSTKALPGPVKTPAEIRDDAAAFLGLAAARADGRQIHVTENGGNTDFQTYSVTVMNPDGSQIRMDYTRQGGHLLWFMNPRPVQARKINFDTARNKASEFLIRHHYPGMVPVTYDEYDNVAVFTFVGTKDGVRIYPDKVTVRVALDNGEIVGLKARDHVFADKTLSPGQPKIPRDEAAKALNPEFRVLDYALAVIENDMQKPVLTHEFVGKINGGTYRIYINAETGLEETIEKIPDDGKPIFAA